MNDLQAAIARYSSQGWNVTAMTEQNFIASKKGPYSPIGLILGVIGLFFWLVPGILILILTAVSRSTKIMVMTLEQAQAEALAIEQAAREAALQPPKPAKIPWVLVAIVVASIVFYVWHGFAYGI